MSTERRPARRRAKAQIPEFASIQEEAEFWDTHDTTDFEDHDRIQFRCTGNVAQRTTGALGNDMPAHAEAERAAAEQAIAEEAEPPIGT